ncbi:TonB-dependent receptor [Halioxenophilus aromaticivorans]|uniref:TonB-dependent receptor n=1 Tax=Halioxenophilus aromaticivorans TaxID=1306992 RepID=A0AAV3U2L2_9ALTE
MPTYKTLPLVVSAVTATLAAPYLHAQTALEEVVVTAQRKAETLQDAALPIDAAGEAELNRIGVSDASMLSKVSPALTVASAGGSNNIFFVRGVGNFAVNAYTDSALAFNIDGIAIGRPTATTASFLDVNRIEVLKGPQGTLYGRNATAGAINVIPNTPTLGETSGSLSAELGNYGKTGFSGAVNLALDEQWAARLSLAKLDSDGYNDDGTGATDDTALRGQLFGELSDNVSLRIAADYSTSQGDGSAPIYRGNYGFQFGPPSDNPNTIDHYDFNPAPSNVSDGFGGPLTPVAQAYYQSLATVPAFTTPNPTEKPFLDNTFWGVNAELNAALDIGDLVVIAGYREAEADNLFINPGMQAAIIQDDQDQFSLEARLSTSSGPVDWILGGYYFDEEVSGLASYNQQSIQSTQGIDASTSESKAVFARGTFNVSDSFRLVGGLRYTDDEKQFTGRSDTFVNLCIRYLPVFPGGPEIPNCEGAPAIPAGATVADTLALIDAADLPVGAPGIGTGPVPYGQVPLFPGAPATATANLLLINPTEINQTQTAEEITYRLAAEWDVGADSLLYASFETGYRSGGFSLAAGREQYDPEYLDAFTLGSKNRFFEDRLQINAELFHWQYDDQQASHFGVDASGNSTLYTENIGSSTIEGLELDILLAATNSTRLRANVQYLKNTIDDFSFVQPTADPDVHVVTGCDSSFIELNAAGNALWQVDCSGQEGRNSPEWTATFGVDQQFSLADINAVLSLDARYRDDRWVGFDFTPPQRAESVTTLDATLQLDAASGQWSLLAYARNITNEEVQSVTQVLSEMSNLVTSVYEPPRTYGLRFNYFF